MLIVDGDAALADQSEPVTVVLVRPDGETELTVNRALRRMLTQQDQARHRATIQSAQLVWNIPQHELAPDTELTPGDVVRDSQGTEWTILSATLHTLQSRWRAVCQKRK